MKKFLTLTMLFASIALTAFTAEAKTTTATSLSAPQVTIQLGQNRRNIRRNNRVRVVTQTRIVRVGRQRYREVVQIRYRANGTTTRVISRTRIR